MSLRAIFILIRVFLAPLVLSLLGVVLLDFQAQRAIVGAESQRYESHKLAVGLCQNSDDLTRRARAYVVAGDVRYAEYFHRILAIRNGEAPRPEDYDGIHRNLVVVRGDRPNGKSPACSKC